MSTELRGARVALIGGHLAYKPHVFDAAARLGVDLVLCVDVDNQQGAPRPPDLLWDAAGDEAAFVRAAEELAAALAGRGIDGVVTFWDYCLPVAAVLAERLGVARVPAAALWTGKSKLLTYQALQARGNPFPPRVVELGEGVERAAAAARTGLPAVLRLSHGASAIGTRLVRDVAELERELVRLRALLRDPAYAAVASLPNKLLLVEYLAGSEHDVDVVIERGRPVFAFVTDNGPTDEPYFRETSHLFPSGRSPAVRAALCEAAVACLRDLDLTSGVYNVELRQTAGGPRLLEINGRTGGFYIVELTRRIWGYDLVEAALAIACGRPPPAAPAAHAGHVAGFMRYPSDPFDEAALPADAIFCSFGHEDPAEYEAPLGSYSFPAEAPAAALAQARAAARPLYGPVRGALLEGYVDALARALE